MPRRSRISENGYYHVINRGVEKRKIYLDNPDYLKFLHLLTYYRVKYDFVIHAYCLMSNHYHLLIEIKHRNLSEILQKINYLYSRYFNKKYQRVGHLWQGRFKSWYVIDEHYLHTLHQYIEQNPIRAGITNNVGEYPWSSTTTNNPALTKQELSELDVFHNSRLPCLGLVPGKFDSEIARHP